MGASKYSLSSAISTRRLQSGDHPAVLAIADSLAAWFDADARCRAIPTDVRNQHGFVALLKGKVAGFVTCFFSGGRLNIGWIGVDPRLHGRGIGTRLITRAEALGRKRGVAVLRACLPAGQVTSKSYEATRAFFWRREFLPHNRIGCPQDVDFRRLLAVWYSPEPDVKPWRGMRPGMTIRSAIRKLGRLKNTQLTPGTEATEREIAGWEERTGFLLPGDYRHYLLTVGECRMHMHNPDQSHSFAIRLLPLGEVMPAAEVIGPHVDDVCAGCRSWYAVADLQDGNYALMDLATVDGDAVKIIDGFHELCPFELAVVAESFTEFLGHAISDRHISGHSGSGDPKKGTRFWSKPGGFYGEANPKQH